MPWREKWQWMWFFPVFSPCPCGLRLPCFDCLVCFQILNKWYYLFPILHIGISQAQRSLAIYLLSQSRLGKSRDLYLVIECSMLLTTSLCYLLNKHPLTLLRAILFLKIQLCHQTSSAHFCKTWNLIPLCFI